MLFLVLTSVNSIDQLYGMELKSVINKEMVI